MKPQLIALQNWYAKFKTKNFSLEDEPREGRPRTATDEQNVAAVKAVIEENPRTTIEQLEQSLGIDATSVGRILHEHLGLTKKAARWVPHTLKTEQKEARVNFCQRFLQQFKNGASVNFRNIVTGDESWFHFYDPETKKQSKEWSKKGAAAPSKPRRQKSVGKTMFAVFFTQNGITASVPLEERKTVTSKWYVEECLPKVFENLLNGRPEAELRRFFLHHDNAPAHTARNTIDFIGRSGINLIEPPPYSPDLAPCDFWLFSKIKDPLRGKLLETREELTEAVNDQLHQIKNEDFKLCFQNWLKRMQKCIDIGGNYVE